MEIADKADLLAMLGALLDGVRTLSPAEKELLPAHSVGITPTLLKETRRAILQGEDPLGEAYARILSPEVRRRTGTTFTPPELVESMFALAEEIVARPSLIVDCGAGSGRFSLAALRRHRSARVVASESNPLLALIVRANARVAGLDSRLKVVVGDFRELTLPDRTGPTLFIGNPPYVRHHDIEPQWKHWYADELARHGLDGSRLAGLHLHFFVKVRQLGQAGDAGCFVTSAEWLDTNYGVGLRQLLLNGLGGRQVHLFPAERSLFADALTTSVITTFQIGATRPGIGFTETNTNPQRVTHWVPTQELQQASGWSRFARPQADVAVEATATLGDFFKVQRGQVTGANAIWIARQGMPDVPRKYLFPAVLIVWVSGIGIALF